MVKVWFEIQGDPAVLSFDCPFPLSQENLIKHFPIPGVWHFRAKISPPNYFEEYVWLDLAGGSGKLPQFEGKVYVKAFPVEPQEIAYEPSNDLIEVRQEVLPDEEPERGLEKRQTESLPRRSSQENVLKEASTGISFFGKAMAASAKAAMEAVKKNVG